LKKVTRRKGGTEIRNTRKNGYSPKTPRAWSAQRPPSPNPNPNPTPKALSQIRIPRRTQRVALKLIPQFFNQSIHRLRRPQRIKLQPTDDQIHLPRNRVNMLHGQRMIAIHQTLTRQRRKTAFKLRAQLRKIHHQTVPITTAKGRDPEPEKTRIAPRQTKNSRRPPTPQYAPDQLVHLHLSADP